jgi:hypothetical protein
MRHVSILLGLALVAGAVAPLAAQGVRLPPRPSAREGRSVAPLPASRAVSAGLNPATELISKRRKLGLDNVTLDSLKALENAYRSRHDELFSRYDSLRAQVQMSRNRLDSTRAPSPEEQQIARERTIVLSRVMDELRADRAAQIEETLAAIPEAKRAEAQTMLDEQAADLERSFRRAGPEGNALAGPGRRSPEPTQPEKVPFTVTRPR